MAGTKPFTFDRVVRLVIGLAIFIALFLLTKRLSGVLLPFLIAWLIAYLLQPIVHFFQYRLKFGNRLLSVVTVLLLFGLLLGGAVYLLIPVIGEEIDKLSQIIALYVNGIDMNTIIPVSWQNQIRYYLSHLDIQSVLKDQTLMDAIKKVTPQIWSIFNGSLSVILGLTMVFVVLMYLIFILLDYEKVTHGIFSIVPPKYREMTAEVIHDLEAGMSKYFRGQALIALIVAVLFAVGFSIVGLPMAILFGLFLGILNLVPYLKTIAIVPGTFLAFLQSAETGESFLSIMFWLILVFLIIQILEDLIIVPRIMGKYTGLNPAIILLALSVWGSLMGVVGLIIALPMTTLLISYYKRFILKEENTGNLPVPDVVDSESDEKDI